jgi:hypothetical protein
MNGCDVAGRWMLAVPLLRAPRLFDEPLPGEKVAGGLHSWRSVYTAYGRTHLLDVSMLAIILIFYIDVVLSFI